MRYQLAKAGRTGGVGDADREGRVCGARRGEVRDGDSLLAVGGDRGTAEFQ